MGVDPVSIGLMALSGLSSVAGSAAQKKQADYNAAVAQQNAAAARANATAVARAGQQKEQSEAWKVRGLIGQQTAAQSANGLDVNGGSAQDVRASTAALGNLGIDNVRNDAFRAYYGQLAAATNYDNQAALAKASAPTLFGSLLSAASAVGGAYMQLGGIGPAGKSGGGVSGGGGSGSGGGTYGLNYADSRDIVRDMGIIY